jgi:peptidoglycan/xylan/chitin deacetylase (PgdA/CDA1 family)
MQHRTLGGNLFLGAVGGSRFFPPAVPALLSSRGTSSSGRCLVLKRNLRRAAFHTLRASGVIAMRRRLRCRGDQGTAAVLCFHRVNPDLPEDGVTIAPDRFRGILSMLRDRYVVLGIDGFVDQLRDGRPFTGREVVLTFDDGYLDNFVHAAPLLEEFGLPATFFVVAGHVGTERTFWWDREKGVDSRMMSWDQVRQLAGSGHTIGAHTWSHPDLGTEPVSSAPRELGEARGKIEDEVGRPVRHFAFPYGGRANFTPEWSQAVRRHGFESCFAAFNGLATRHSDPYLIERIGASPQRSVEELAIDMEEAW